MSDTCLFCKIISNEIGGDIVYHDDQVTAFRDINPVAPTHVLIVPNKHIDSVNTLEVADEQLLGHLITTAGKLAKEEGIDEGGYRLIMNTNADGGQTVFHIHLHLIGGQSMKHPMG
ncbi:MAG TPA: histidine triad nucleotide-binding protein [Anaerolineales bacterium]|nr:histidine triad nucleotide-binding protein [Anaerolineales bacterium]